MDHLKSLSTVFNCWKFHFTIITQWWAIVDFVTQNWLIFHKTFKIFEVINQKPCDVCGQKLVWVVSTIGSTNTPSFIKIWEVTQNSLLIWHGMTLVCVCVEYGNLIWGPFFIADCNRIENIQRKLLEWSLISETWSIRTDLKFWSYKYHFDEEIWQPYVTRWAKTCRLRTFLNSFLFHLCFV